MPLGPIPTDATSGYDHISSAIGSAYLGKLGIAKVINSITREEHTGGVPTFDSIVEGLVSARIAAHIVDIDSIPKSNEIDRHVVNLRNANRSCIAGFSMFSNKEQFTNNPGCIRCNEECPLNII
jgi:phosphomethylpyrimidine synthase